MNRSHPTIQTPECSDSCSISARRSHRDATIAYWRTSDIDAARLPDANVVEARRSALASGETLAENGRLLVPTLPVRARFHGGRAAIIYPTGAKPDEPVLDDALIKAVARAHAATGKPREMYDLEPDTRTIPAPARSQQKYWKDGLRIS